MKILPVYERNVHYESLLSSRKKIFFRVITRIFRVITRIFRVITRMFRVITLIFRVITRIFRVITRMFRVITRMFRVITRMFRVITRMFRVITRIFRVITRISDILRVAAHVDCYCSLSLRWEIVRSKLYLKGRKVKYVYIHVYGDIAFRNI